MNIYNDIARKFGNITVKHFRKYEKLQYKNNKLKLDIDFLNNCEQLGVYPKFVMFKLANVSNKDAVSIRKSCSTTIYYINYDKNPFYLVIDHLKSYLEENDNKKDLTMIFTSKSQKMMYKRI